EIAENAIPTDPVGEVIQSFFRRFGWRSKYPRQVDDVAFRLVRLAHSLEEGDCRSFVNSLENALWNENQNFPISRHEAFFDIIIEILGNPFHPVTIARDWLTWKDGTVPKLAQTIYDDRRFD